MIIGIGVDVVELDRIQKSHDRFGEKFIRKILTPKERELMPEKNPLPYLAARFAGKEASAKALGTGFVDGMGLKDIEIASLDSGKPTLVFLGKAKAVCDGLGVKNTFISLSHGRDVAVATVVLEG